jgi:2-phosphosulfolactate phosphatase
MAIEIRLLQQGDEAVLTAVTAGVFDNDVDERFVAQFLSDARHHIAVAIEDGLVVGFASAVHYIHPDKQPELWINEVAVSPKHRGRGLGKGLLSALFKAGQQYECAEAWVLTDRANIPAMRLYSSLGGTDSDQVMFTFKLTGGASSRSPSIPAIEARPFYDQSEFDIRCEWGLSGIRLVGVTADVLIFVDALSFSTCVDVAVSRGAEIFPCRWKDDIAIEYARQLGAELAVARGKAERFSLSPVSMRNAIEGTRIVLPSPNGAELTMVAEKLGPIVLTGCFRNCQAVAKYAAARGKTIAVIPCGERWPDGTLRHAVEDMAAAGAIIANLPGAPSPEARAAVSIWNSAKNDLAAFLKSCASGRELIERGFEEDVKIAGEVNASSAVPILRERAYIRAGEAL